MIIIRECDLERSTRLYIGLDLRVELLSSKFFTYRY